MRLLFIVQGEGRGHLTQAISLAQLLQEAGHEVIGAWVNVATGRPVPPFFVEQFTAPIISLPGPALVYDPQTNALDLKTTIRGIIRQLPTFRQSVRQLRMAILTEKPDIVVNFFELLGGLTYGLYRPSTPMVCVGHQCLAFHDSFTFPKGSWFDKLLFKALVRLNSWGATELFGLSFDQQTDVPRRRLRVMPLLLRRELTACRIQDDRTDCCPYVLAYTTQPGLVSEVLEAHRQCPEMVVHYFNATTQETQEQVDNHLFFHRIDGIRYLKYMQHCEAVVTTAGFESVCEALYLGKPVLMMPQPNHYEQACNALDGQRVGAGLAANRFDLRRLLTYLPTHDHSVSNRFKNWYASGEWRFVIALQRLIPPTNSAT
ncbi:glycosyl transferase [Fibrella sp. HMF5335]|uniref:Glycosyl transferase n=1 Tax=Fibrella rubiginis TaxID=2817060 RepID=A0A939GJ48_9BACT|nr:glycosyltransferase family protein [Fibrella rubiginis]MBO0939271.1 glycosyl transferase [Fibrella rubiginis]